MSEMKRSKLSISTSSRRRKSSLSNIKQATIATAIARGTRDAMVKEGDKIERMTVRLSSLEAKRDEKRRSLEELFEQKMAIQTKMNGMQEDLQGLDDEIDKTETELRQFSTNATSAPAGTAKNKETQVEVRSADNEINAAQRHERPQLDQLHVEEEESRHPTLTCADELLTDPLTCRDDTPEKLPQQDAPPPPPPGYDERDLEDDIHDYYNEEEEPEQEEPPEWIEATSISGIPPTVERTENSGGDRTASITTVQNPYRSSTSAPSSHNNIPTLDHFFQASTERPPSCPSGLSSATRAIPQEQRTSLTVARDTRNGGNYTRESASDNFPWSQDLVSCLQNVFRIERFRDQQKEIINCTMSGNDAFVIMRTGGGKSLTYQLPALLEGCGRERKVSIVISPLLSLIRDQVDQMNEFSPGSAVAFTSGMKGGNAQHAQQWEQVRDPKGGIVLVFVTPERVSSSKKLQNELEKLNDQKRLGRFVIDECHCASNWGHDFRPDYTKLGILKHHFPHIPLIAVTATASKRVREDCCKLLHIDKNYQFFRSTANRPNLKYTVRQKSDLKERSVDDMANFIKSNYPNQAGIIYTLSRKEADDVASKLCDRGIVAEAYHSSVSDSAKDHVHRSWMNNQTQVVCATIAFGLGINKPDVRFVLHHSLSKSLEAYYQESGRAGRDGKPADCVLYYSTKDVARMLCMVHNTNGELSFWSMVRYAHAFGSDAVCRATILRVLGEPDIAVVQGILDNDTEGVEEREVGKHAKTVTELVKQVTMIERKDLTQPQLVALWRGTKEPPPCVKKFPPNKELSKEDCDWLIVSLMLSDILQPKVTWSNPYSSCMYMQLGPKAQQLLSSSDPNAIVRFPLRQARQLTKARKPSVAAAAVQSGSGWIAAKKKRAPLTSFKRSTKKTKISEKKQKAVSGKSNRSDTVGRSSDVIEIILSSSEEEDGASCTRNKRPKRAAKSSAQKKMKRSSVDLFESSDSEAEFHD